MQISPINNANFNGKFKKTPTLENLLAVSDKETLGRFNEVVDRMTKVNDGLIYRITHSSEKSPITSTIHVRFSLNKVVTQNNFDFCERVFSRFINSYDNVCEQYEKCADVLKQFLPILEKEYPKTNFEKSNRELLEEINKKLI